MDNLKQLDRFGDAYAVALQLCDLLSAQLSPRAVRVVTATVSSYSTTLAIEGDDGVDWLVTIDSPSA